MMIAMSASSQRSRSTKVIAAARKNRATVAVIQGTIPLLLAPIIGVRLGFVDLLLAWAIMFAMGMAITAIGVFLGVYLANRLAAAQKPKLA